jgi:hypothetical protein
MVNFPVVNVSQLTLLVHFNESFSDSLNVMESDQIFGVHKLKTATNTTSDLNEPPDEQLLNIFQPPDV